MVGDFLLRSYMDCEGRVYSCAPNQPNCPFAFNTWASAEIFGPGTVISEAAGTLLDAIESKQARPASAEPDSGAEDE